MRLFRSRRDPRQARYWPGGRGRRLYILTRNDRILTSAWVDDSVDNVGDKAKFRTVNHSSPVAEPRRRP